jgi:hypothetical protein
MQALVPPDGASPGLEVMSEPRREVVILVAVAEADPRHSPLPPAASISEPAGGG